MNEEPNGSDALDELYWRAEILQALYWMRGEGLAEKVEPTGLAAFLATDPVTVSRHLERMAGEGYVEHVAHCEVDQSGGYRLTTLGEAEGARSFRDDFAELTRPTHGECSTDCWCHDPAHAGEPCPSHPERSHGT